MSHALNPDELVGSMIANANKLAGIPDAGSMQAGMLQAASGFAIAAAIRDLAAAVRETRKP